MLKGLSIAGVINSFQAHGAKVQYKAFFDLLEFLAKEEMITDKTITTYFASHWMEPSGLLTSLVRKLVSSPEKDVIQVREEVLSMPFFRVLDPSLVEIFFQHTKIIEAPKNIFITQANQVQRSLFVLLRGQASVFRPNPDGGKPTRVSTLGSRSVFGEVGFFLGQKRTTDVVTDEESVFLQIQYDSSYERLFATAGEEIHRRFWFIKAMEKSEVFGRIPDDCFDELAVAGKTQVLPPNQAICKQGDEGDSMYIIIQGGVRVIKNAKEVSKLGIGDCFGEIALMKTGGRRTATIETVSETVVVEISEESFANLLANNLALACEMESLVQKRSQLTAN